MTTLILLAVLAAGSTATQEISGNMADEYGTIVVPVQVEEKVPTISDEPNKSTIPTTTYTDGGMTTTIPSEV